MAYAGARGSTATEMLKVLRFGPLQSKLHETFHATLLSMNKGQGDYYNLTVADAMFVHKHFPTIKEFRKLIAANYMAGIKELDFSGDPTGTAKFINKWISDWTEEKIKDVVTPDMIQTSVIALVNTIYFRGLWTLPFNPDATTVAKFDVSPGYSTKARMMVQTARFRYGLNRRLRCQILELPYEGDRLAMYILLPTDRYGLAELEKKLTFNTVTQALARLWHRRMSVAIPKIKMTVLAKRIPKKLENMGMKKLFTLSADFTGISHVRPLFVSDVIHKAFVDIDEVGTEAAAATVVLFSRSLPQSIHKDFTVDHPYLFLIRDSITGSILFLGRVVLPES